MSEIGHFFQEKHMRDVILKNLRYLMSFNQILILFSLSFFLHNFPYYFLSLSYFLSNYLGTKDSLKKIKLFNMVCINITFVNCLFLFLQTVLENSLQFLKTFFFFKQREQEKH